ncbi:MAG: hypothetical protein K0S29_613 [Gammaproteobacteria bacterium]|jgi:predicted transcriptional regulator|nr:hypothetical protein [Gammaproteobacteria bacterium]
MARTIARVVHDIKPSVETINELVNVLEQIAGHSDDKKLSSQLKEGLHKLNELIETVKDYLEELDTEAKRNGILK